MNRKNIKLMILAVLVATTFSTGTVLAAKPDFSDKKGAKVQQKEEKSDKKEKEEKDNKKQDKANKKVSKEARIIDQRLDHIEKTLDKINEKMDSYFNNIEEPAETTTGSSIDGTLGQNDEAAEADSTEKLEDTSKEDAVVDSNDTESTNEASVSNSDEDTENSSEVDADDNTEVGADDNTEVGADEQDLSNDFEEEYENEDEETNNSFYGKLSAVMNRLNTVKRQLGRISTVDDPQIAELNTRTEALVKEVQESISKLGTIQQKKVDALKSKTNKKVMEEEKIDAAKKSWKIRFTKQINPDTINSENISVIDSKNNVIDAEVSYSSNTNEVIIEVKDGFKKGESYSILIGDNVKSADGKNLTTSVQKDFSVK
ncbi:Ig-like domain-containing protein [Clostridium sp. CX1]|uniref:Ig-like domain-containing protein n=1 Tax=Clostridium sp. CX1 TaxID=2978346 RepID=UPI0021C216FC|nr:Ig-like domain-containing protein [Clostridium sp. CX1]MCT8975611.1 Ig-like domain-containing protein [Clostridium sp. CX1]